jgi:glycosyltransferase involved in cell wall biosynthesis
VRLLYLGDAASPHLLAWPTFFARRGHEVHACDLRGGERVGLDGVEWHATPWAMRTRLRGAWPLAAWSVRALLRALRPNVVHSHGIVPAAYLAARAGCAPHVATAWGSEVLRAPARHRSLIRRVARSADVLTADSRHLLAALRRHGAPDDRLRLVPWGVDFGWPTAAEGLSRDECAQRLGLPAGRPLVLAHRGINPVYRSETVIRALAHVMPAVPDVLAVVIYDPDTAGALLPPLQALATELGVAAHVTFVPKSPHARMPLFYRAASVCVSVPEGDSAPTSVVEAMALGTPTVVSDLPWVHEPEYRGAHLRVVAVGDARGLAKSLVEELRSPSPRDGELNRRLVAQRFDRERIFSEVELLYERLAG